MEQKKKKLLETAFSLFKKHGITRVTVKEICAESGVSKGTFYKYFTNKTNLTEVILKKETEQGMQRYREIMNSEIRFEEKVEQLIRMKLDQTKGMSSEFVEDLLTNAPVEIGALHHQLSAAAVEEIMEDLRAAQEKGEISREIRPGFILWFLGHMTDMVQDQNLKGLYPSPSDMMRELMRFFFYGIMPGKGQS